MPPMVGVPALVFWCRSGVSSRTELSPCCIWRSRLISHGPSRKEITRAVTVAIAVRKVMYRNTLNAVLYFASGTRSS